MDDATTFEKPLPKVTLEAEPYWEGCRLGELRFQICADCASPVFPPRCVCPYCMSLNLNWSRSSGRGTVYTFTTVHRPPHSIWADKVPYTLAVIEMEESYFMFSEIINCDPEAVYLGMPVEVVFQEVNDEVSLPLFEQLSG